METVSIITIVTIYFENSHLFHTKLGLHKYTLCIHEFKAKFHPRCSWCLGQMMAFFINIFGCDIKISCDSASGKPSCDRSSFFLRPWMQKCHVQWTQQTWTQNNKIVNYFDAILPRPINWRAYLLSHDMNNNIITVGSDTSEQDNLGYWNWINQIMLTFKLKLASKFKLARISLSHPCWKNLVYQNWISQISDQYPIWWIPSAKSLSVLPLHVFFLKFPNLSVFLL